MNDESARSTALLGEVANRLTLLPSNTDYLMLTKWRVLSIAQHLLGQPPKEFAQACRTALQTFVLEGPGPQADRALADVHKATRKLGPPGAILPAISAPKRAAVVASLESFASKPDVIERANRLLPRLKERVEAAQRNLPLTGLKHRFERAALLLEDPAGTDPVRRKAAAAMLYLDAASDAIPDELGAIGLMDDDYAFRITLEEVLDPADRPSISHWSEKISALWDDLPFLQGVNLQRSGKPLSVSWLDRLNSYVAYNHALSASKNALVLLEPSIVCSPLHLIISLLGLLVLEAITSSENRAMKLRLGQTYEVDGKHHVRFVGIDSTTWASGWLRLAVRDGFVVRPPSLADRMVPVDERRLSLGADFPAEIRPPEQSLVQRFFGWDTAMRPSLPTQIALVTSQQRAQEMLKDVVSNGVALLDHGLVRFVGPEDKEFQTYGTFMFVAPSLTAVRAMLSGGVHLQSVIIDGYARLRRDRHELSFIEARTTPPAILLWTVKGYYPTKGTEWLTQRCLELTRDDLGAILELDSGNAGEIDVALRRAAANPVIELHRLDQSSGELALLEAIDAYLAVLRAASALPSNWAYLFWSRVKLLALVVGKTPATWPSAREMGHAWSSFISERWRELRPTAQEGVRRLREAESAILEILDRQAGSENSTATALLALANARGLSDPDLYFVCNEREQLNAADTFLRTQGFRRIHVVLLDALPVASACIVGGWLDASFAARLFAHSPQSLSVLGTESDGRRWQKAAGMRFHRQGQSLVSAVSAAEELLPADVEPAELVPVEASPPGASAEEETWQESRVPCVLLWLSGQPEAKALARHARVVFEDGDVIKDTSASLLKPNDRIILGSGVTGWSPEEDFTNAVVEAVRASQPSLVNDGVAWRIALAKARDGARLSTFELRARLAALGVSREPLTLEGWLNLERPSPIAPRSIDRELKAMWPMIGHYTDRKLPDVIAACHRLRQLRETSGRALLRLWKGQSADLGIDQSAADELVSRLRREVQVYQVETIAFGEIPASMLGLWLPSWMAAKLEMPHPPDGSETGEAPPFTTDDT